MGEQFVIKSIKIGSQSIQIRFSNKSLYEIFNHLILDPLVSQILQNIHVGIKKQSDYSLYRLVNLLNNFLLRQYSNSVNII